MDHPAPLPRWLSVPKHVLLDARLTRRRTIVSQLLQSMILLLTGRTSTMVQSNCEAKDATAGAFPLIAWSLDNGGQPCQLWIGSDVHSESNITQVSHTLCSDDGDEDFHRRRALRVAMSEHPALRIFHFSVSNFMLTAHAPSPSSMAWSQAT